MFNESDSSSFETGVYYSQSLINQSNEDDFLLKSFVWSSMNDINVFVSLNCLFSFAVSPRKWLAYFLFIRSNGWTLRNKHLSSQINDGFFHLFHQIKVSRIPLYVGHCHVFAWRVTWNYAYSAFNIRERKPHN